MLLCREVRAILRPVLFTAFFLLVFLALRPVRAQEGMALDTFTPALGAGDLVACRGLSITEGRLSLGLAGGWNWHLMGKAEPGQKGWLVEQNLSGGVGLELDLENWVRLGFSAYGAAWQRGERIDDWGEHRKLSPGWGESWLWLVLQLARFSAWQLAAEYGLRLPSASEEALLGEPAWGSREGLMGQVEIYPFRFLLNATMVERRRSVFYRLERSSSLQTAAGAELAPKGFPVALGVEFWSEGGLENYRRTALMQLVGSAIIRLGGWRLVVGAGWGIRGEGTARLRVFLGMGTALSFSRSHSE